MEGEGIRDSLEDALRAVEDLTPTAAAGTASASKLDWNDEDLMSMLEDEEGDSREALGGSGALAAQEASRRVLASLDDFEVMADIGKGASATTKLVRRRDNHAATFAMKVIRTGVARPVGAKAADWSSRSALLSKQAAAEVSILARLSHRNIISYHGSFVRPDACYILMEYAEAGDLEHHLHDARKSGEAFSEEEVMGWATQILLGLDYLHSQNILHRDIKLANVFRTKANIIKVPKKTKQNPMRKNDAPHSITPISNSNPDSNPPSLCAGSWVTSVPPRARASPTAL